jgi:RNA polymerase sigma-B factor
VPRPRRTTNWHCSESSQPLDNARCATVSSSDTWDSRPTSPIATGDRFDPDYGGSFSSFAGPTIEGEIKRHFRDRSWVVRVPRSAKELHLQVRRASDELSHEIGRSPSVEEIARHLDIDRDDVLRGVAAGAAYNVGTIDAASADDGSDAGMDRQSMLATVEHGFEDTENREVILELLDRLPEREHEIVRLRFYERLSQSEIADIVGISQMHVSRLLRRSFDQMREWLDEDHGASSAAARE